MTSPAEFSDKRPLPYFRRVPFNAVARRVLAGFEQNLRPRLPALLPGGCAAEAATASYLEWARQTTEDALVARAQEFTPLQWLHYLRATPGEWWAGKLKTTAIYDTSLAETISAKSTKSSAGEPSFPIDDTIANKVAEFCAGTISLSHIHSMLRWAGKGAAINFAQTALGSADPTPGLSEAVKLYDSRTELAEGMMFSRTGLGSSERQPGCVSGIPVVTRLPGDVASGGVVLRFTMGFCCLDDLARFNRMVHAAGQSWWGNESGVLTAFLHQATQLVLDRKIQVLSCGCLFTNTDNLRSAAAAYVGEARRVIEDVFPGTRIPNTIEKLVKTVAKMGGSTWPMVQGPIVRSQGDLICLDLYSASMRLNQVTSFRPAGGYLARVKGPELEKSVQALIDGSPWALSPAMRAVLVGKKPKRLDGSELTDLDAVGLKDDVLLLVSCKSRAYSASYDLGDRSEVRKVEREALDALQSWIAKTNYMKSNPLCLDGFDFSKYTILPVVCFPFVPYIAIGPATAEVAKGLRAVSSLAELRAWLFS